MNGAIPAGTRSPLEQYFIVALSKVIGYSMVLAMTVTAGSAMAAQGAWKALTLQPKGRHATRHGRPATR